MSSYIHDLYIHVHIPICMHIHIHMHMHVCIYTYVCACTQFYLYTCIYREKAKMLYGFYQVKDTYFLVSLVDNDYVGGDIFAVFEGL